MKAAAIINWNSGRLLQSCIESLLPVGDDLDILVVDNASEDDSLEPAKAAAGRVRIVRNDKNLGFAGGVNRAFAETSAAHVLILNPDVIALPGAVDYLDRFLAGHARAGAVGGHVNESYTPLRLPTAASMVLRNLGFERAPDSVEHSNPRQVDQPAGAALMIRRQAFDDVGGFDERFHPAWYEDVDFCRRLKTADWGIYYAPLARFAHKGAYSAKALGAAGFAAAYYRNQLRYAHKHFGTAAALAVRGSIAAGMIGRMAVKPNQARGYWNVLTGALRHW